MKVCLLLLMLASYAANAQKVFDKQQPLAHTYSIVAIDSVTGEMAIGVQSHWFSVGTSVPWVQAGVGVVATQSFIDKSYGTNGLLLIQQGYTAQEALDSLIKADPAQDIRQVSILDFKGNIATHTGAKCIQYASHIKDKYFSVQSNMMLRSTVCDAMAAAFRNSAAKPLAERVLLALEAAQNAGGDARGSQSAALLVVPNKATGQPWNDVSVDLRVDDNAAPLKELRRLYQVHLAYNHMNNGDVAVEKNDMTLAMTEYNAAMKMFPSNLEMKYWTAITLANNKKLNKAMPILKSIFATDKNWKTLTKRLPAVGLLTVSQTDLQKILAL